ncbi:glycerophosphodiester phosphodiesterase family protein [Nostocoides vanveenii]|uniref:Glycerophosphodiester phosphodiesterase n=1 Tax=Nostocoides vanveenii TaxID=330835 RepID=A0ABN2KTN6_9MICO
MRAADHPYFDTTGPVGLAHRGGAEFTPNVGRENTIAAFGAAIDLGFRYLETDVHTTSDGVLVAFHDTVLDRVTDTAGAIADLPYAVVAAARTAAGDGIPLLDEVLETFPEARINIDVKAVGAIEPLVAAIRSHSALDRVCVGSFSDARLAAVRKALGPGLATAMGPRGVAQMRFTPHLLSRILHSPAPVLQIPTGHTVRGRRVRLVTPGLVRQVHRLGKHLHVWTIDDPAEMRRLLDLGVDGIVTDRPDTLVDVFGERQLTP